MKVSRNSWHYKLCSSTFSCPSKSLCIYFWQVPIAVTAWVFTIFVSLVLAFTAVFILALPVMFNFWSADYEVILIAGVLSVLFWREAIFKPFNNRFKNSSWNITLIKKRTTKKASTTKKKSLVYEYLKAKKDKVCPTIEFDWS